MNKTYSAKPSEVTRRWILIDASEAPLGRIATVIATYLTGKNKPMYTPHIDCGDYVVIINASKAKFTGAKLEVKNYYTHSGYFGSTKTHKMSDMIEKNPEKLFKLATRGMLPKTTLGKAMLKKLKVYAGSEHPHTAQIKG